MSETDIEEAIAVIKEKLNQDETTSTGACYFLDDNYNAKKCFNDVTEDVCREAAQQYGYKAAWKQGERCPYTE